MYQAFFNRSFWLSSLLLIFSLEAYATEQERYLHFTEVDGLPRNITTCIEQDQFGYLWIGTRNGIARYDGKNFIDYPELTENYVNDLKYDCNNTLWVVTDRGLYKYNRLTNYFEHLIEGYISKIQEENGKIFFMMMSNIVMVKDDTTSVVYEGNQLTDFFITHNGIWISQVDHGASLLSKESGYRQVIARHLPGKSIALIEGVNDQIFFGLYNGQLYALDKSGNLKQIEVDNHYFYSEILKINDEIWIGTDGNGIIILDADLRFIRKLSREDDAGTAINSNSIKDIFQGSNHEIWIATYGAGLTCILPDNLLFTNILPEKGNNNSLVANEAVSVFVKEQKVYFGTNYGLSAWDASSNQFKNLNSQRLRKDLNGNKVTAVFVDDKKQLWLGTYDGLMGKYNENYQLLQNYHPCSEAEDEMQQIIQITEAGEDNLLILTLFHSNILLNFNINTAKSEVFELNYKGSKATYFMLNTLKKNQQGEQLALISNMGLFHVNLNENVLENRLESMNSLINGNLTDFYNDKKGYYWFASSTQGLIRISADGKQYNNWTVKEGLPSNTLVSLESSDDHYLWLSTIDGICRFDMETHETMNFNHRDGLPANEFQERAAGLMADGRIIFGSIAGFTLIDPTKISIDSIKTRVVIYDITFQNQSIRTPDGQQYLNKPLEETTELSLPYNKNSFTIHFFTKNKSISKYNSYSYRLVGLNENWTYQGETNYTTYTNLSAGSYTFEIISADNRQSGVVTSLNINIQAPWYLSWYAFTIYLILFFVILYLAIYAFLKRFELIKQKEISEFKIQHEHELTEKKLAFFTNISHDLKTPLTLIDAPVNDLLNNEQLSEDQTKKLMIISRNSKRLYKLITDLLDFRKITQKQYDLEVKETYINDVINDACEAFVEECKNKSIHLSYEVTNEIYGFIDAKKVEKILWNLLSNALKFNKKGGFIEVSLVETERNNLRCIQLVVSDSGVGISEQDKNKIFERFYKVHDSTIANIEGTGIGLAIVKELVEIHRGSILLESVYGEGTTFTVNIPIEKNAYLDNELAQDYLISAINNAKEVTKNKQALEKHRQYNLAGILVVEDNVELRDYLAGHFEKRYKVFTAEDGFAGLKIAKEINPDVIITDVQMPKMNGYVFCKEIRKNFDTSHIPVVMLTANNTIEQQIEGLSTGADIYLTKPFDIKLLDAQINSLLENRRTLRNKFHGIETPDNLDKSLPQKDVDFILELKQFIEENILNQDLNVELLSSHFAVSLAQLHRKIKSITGSTPNNMIKSIRLRKAYKLIQESGLRVSEAAYQTGFSDPNYFTICFKKEFGENPSQIASAPQKSNEVL